MAAHPLDANSSAASERPFSEGRMRMGSEFAFSKSAGIREGQQG
jgi:hypothetical protein